MLLLRTQRYFTLTLNLKSISYHRLITRVARKSLFVSTTLAADMETINTTERLRQLRDLMKENRIDVYSMIHEGTV